MNFCRGPGPVCVYRTFTFTNPAAKRHRAYTQRSLQPPPVGPSTITEAPLCSVSACPSYRQTVLTVVSEVDNAA